MITNPIGPRIKALREDKSLSQDDLARLFGFTDRQTVSAIETGERRLTAEELILAVEKLGATMKNEEAWGRRRLAYPIHKSNEGVYHLFVVESEGSLGELDRRMKNVDRVLRHMIVRTDLDHKRAEKLANPHTNVAITSPSQKRQLIL